jgi:hypothetical protein
MLDRLLNNKREMLFIFSLLITGGGWVMSLGSDWSTAIRPASVGGLCILLANGVFANMIKNVGLLGTGVTNESDPATQNKPEVKP